MGIYVEDVYSILLEYTKGYGIWAYRDYCNNMLYNAQFALGLLGWRYTDGVSFVEDTGEKSSSCWIREGGSLAQQIPSVRNHFDSNTYYIEFEVTEINENAKAKIKFGDIEQELVIDKIGVYEIPFEKGEHFDFEFLLLEGDILLDNICKYSFVQEGQLYDINNNKGDYIGNIRVLNK